MKKITKLSKKGKAALGTALLAGATVVGGAAFATAQNHSNSLSDYPAPFVDEDGNVASSIVVGEDAQTIDVAAGMEIAGSLGNNAYTSETVTVEGQETVEVTGETEEEAVRETNVDVDITATEYPDFVRNYEYDEDDNLRVTETAEANVDYDVNTDTDHELGEAEVLVGFEEGDIEYEADYGTGVEEGENIYLMGDQYRITDISVSSDTADLELGSFYDHRNLAVENRVEHGETGWEIEIVDIDEDGDEVLIDIYEDNELVDDAVLAQDEAQQFGDDDEFEVNATRIFRGDRGDRVSLETTLTEFEQDSEEDFFLDDRFEAEIDASEDPDTAEAFRVYNKEETTVLSDDDDLDDLDDDEIEALQTGETFQGPLEAFEVENLGLEDERTEDAEFEDNIEFTYTDPNGFEQNLEVEEDFDTEGFTYDRGSDVIELEDGSEEDVETHFVVETDEDDYTEGLPVYIDIETYDITSSDDEVEITVEYGEDQVNFEESDDDLSGETLSVYSGFGFEIELDTGSDELEFNPGEDFGLFTHGDEQLTTQEEAQTSAIAMPEIYQDSDQTGINVDGLGDSTESDADVNVEGEQGEAYVLEIDVNSNDEIVVYVGDDEEDVTASNALDLSEADSDEVDFDLLASTEETPELTITFDEGGTGEVVESVTFDGDFDDELTSNTFEQVEVEGVFESEDVEDRHDSVADTPVYNEDALEVDLFSETNVVEADGGDDITVVYERYDGDSEGHLDEDLDTGEIAEVRYEDGESTETLDEWDDGHETYTVYGSWLALNDETSVEVEHPEEQREQEISLGTSEVTVGDDQEFTSSSPTGWPDAGVLDSDDDIEQRQSSENMILVGGPVVNDLTQELADRGDSQAREDYREGYGVLELVHGAFDDDYDALVVAGETGSDTRSLGRYLANFEDNRGDWEDTNYVEVDTSTNEVVSTERPSQEETDDEDEAENGDEDVDDDNGENGDGEE